MWTQAPWYILHDVVPEADIALKLLSEEKGYTSLRTIEETTFVLLKLVMRKRYGVKGAYELRKALKKYDLSPVREELKALKDFIEELQEVILKYKVLLGDALIALTCKHYGIRKILTFDEDFKRIPWLEVLP